MEYTARARKERNAPVVLSPMHRDFEARRLPDWDLRVTLVVDVTHLKLVAAAPTRIDARDVEPAASDEPVVDVLAPLIMDLRQAAGVAEEVQELLNFLISHLSQLVRHITDGAEAVRLKGENLDAHLERLLRVRCVQETHLPMLEIRRVLLLRRDRIPQRGTRPLFVRRTNLVHELLHAEC